MGTGEVAVRFAATLPQAGGRVNHHDELPQLRASGAWRDPNTPTPGFSHSSRSAAWPGRGRHVDEQPVIVHNVLGAIQLSTLLVPNLRSIAADAGTFSLRWTRVPPLSKSTGQLRHPRLGFIGNICLQSHQGQSWLLARGLTPVTVPAGSPSFSSAKASTSAQAKLGSTTMRLLFLASVRSAMAQRTRDAMSARRRRSQLWHWQCEFVVAEVAVTQAESWADSRASFRQI